MIGAGQQARLVPRSWHKNRGRASYAARIRLGATRLGRDLDRSATPGVRTQQLILANGLLRRFVKKLPLLEAV